MEGGLRWSMHGETKTQKMVLKTDGEISLVRLRCRWGDVILK